VHEPVLADDEALKSGQLGLRVYKAESAQFTAAEIALIKKRVAAIYGPLVVARSFPLLDPATGN
jgi:hypothetical protein